MKTTKLCKHCCQTFEARRSNHVYCTTSCKTKASYKKNDYKYVSGHYQKEEVVSSEKLAVPANQDLINLLQDLEKKIEGLENKSSIKSASIKEAALGTIAADATIYATKKIFAPTSLPATKGDIVFLRKELNELKIIIQNHLNH
ncbi:hypothetical protein [Algibacter luteus]|uniref:Uncharacterized protein n=1 Tax=Algibacter luteus TaxID=1178825 RepID=A0A1M6HA62_9FLAO|nr:hypothetical protein [Algibacter luteus]SHJ18989.1 hypothetical protein SAMN05216261_3092 [Algibacter luteus]